LSAGALSPPVNGSPEFLNSSTTHTKDEQGAWWQVDLGGKKKINQIIIYNRTDWSPHVVIEPSALRAAKAIPVE
jgi:hypothetical protein